MRNYDCLLTLCTKNGRLTTSPLSNNKNFYEGEIIIIDPEQSAKHSDYVIALLPNANEATFKQYVVDGGISYLKPLNPQYPLSVIEKRTKILGIIKNKMNYF